MKRWGLAAAALTAAPYAAAHSAAGPVSAWLAPLADAALLIGLIAGALWIGQQGRARALLGPFAAALALGLAWNHVIAPSRTQDALLAATALTGVLVTIGRRWPAALGLLLCAALGLQIGRGAELGASLGWARAATAASAWAIACAGVALGGWLVAQARPPWARIGVRVAASWITASAVLVLALAFAP